MERIDAVVGQSTNTNTHLDEVLKRVEDIEVAQSIALYPSSAPEDRSNPLLLNTKRSSQRSKSSSPTLLNLTKIDRMMITLSKPTKANLVEIHLKRSLLIH